MNNAIYAALSRQVALRHEVTTIANNVANVSTAGYRRDEAIFSEFVQKPSLDDQSVSQTRIAGRYLDSRPGILVETGNSLDFAIEGEGYFLIETIRGDRLSRAGTFVLDAENRLTTMSGEPVLSEGGSAISIPTGGQINVTADGLISVDRTPVAKLAIVSSPQTVLVRERDGLTRSTEPPTPLEFARVHQGFIEQSNVDPVIEISRLIEAQRAFELTQQLLRDEDQRISTTIERAGQA